MSRARVKDPGYGTSLVVLWYKESTFQGRGCGFDSWSGTKIPHVVKQLRPCAAARETHASQKEKPVHHN